MVIYNEQLTRIYKKKIKIIKMAIICSMYLIFCKMGDSKNVKMKSIYYMVKSNTESLL